jgi:hypothetical protein
MTMGEEHSMAIHNRVAALIEMLSSANSDRASSIEEIVEKVLSAPSSPGDLPDADVEPLAIGDTLPFIPLFLHPEWCVSTPLQQTDAAAFRGIPAYSREVLEEQHGRSMVVRAPSP